MTAPVFGSLPGVPAPAAADAELAVTVLVCAYTMARWDQTKAALASVLNQGPQPAQLILVVDHNSELAAPARAELTECWSWRATRRRACPVPATRDSGPLASP